MAIRPPRAFAPRPPASPLQSALELEIIAEQAATMGHYGRRLAAAMRRLETGQFNDREDMVGEVAWICWCLFVQREICGLRDHRHIISDYRVPREALNRMGAMPLADASNDDRQGPSPGAPGEQALGGQNPLPIIR